MARGKKFSEHLLAEFARKAETENRRDAVQWFIGLTGVSESTAYKTLKRMKSGSNIHDLAEGKHSRKPRKSEIERQRELRDAQIIAAIKMLPGEGHKPIPTTRAIEIAEDTGQIPVGVYTRSRVDRILRKESLNARSFSNTGMAHRITADGPGHVFVVDATPMDQFYMKIDRSVHHFDAPAGDKHLDDLLHREELSKVWVYYMVDLYSKAWLAWPVASLPRPGKKWPGENADDWLTFLTWVMLPKHDSVSPLMDRANPMRDCPIQGVPKILFCDKGSGIGGSKLIREVFHGLGGARIVTHMPGSPSAKGMVEGRISAVKRSFENALNRDHTYTIEQLQYFYLDWARQHNESRGAYDVWRKGALNYPIVGITMENIHDATVSRIERVIDAYGCVSVDGIHLFLTPNEQYKKTRCFLYRSRIRKPGEEAVYTAQLFDGTIIPELTEIPSHNFERITSHPASRGKKNRDIVREIQRGVRQQVTYDDVLPRDSAGRTENIIHLPGRTVSLETSSPHRIDAFPSKESAIRWILNQGGVFLDDITEKYQHTIDAMLTMTLETHGHIPMETAVALANNLTKHKSEAIK